MVLLALALLVAGFQEPGAPPFGLDLPPGYEAFAPTPGSADSWYALGAGGAARLAVDHFLLENPGAFPTAVADYRRRNLWQPNLQGMEPRLLPWKGRWAGEEAAGTVILIPDGDARRVVLERIAILGDHLILATWEGPEADKAAAEAALDSFRLPGAWKPAPPEDYDAGRGLGAGPALMPYPAGRFLARVDFGDGQRPYIEVDLSVEPDPARRGPWTWLLPQDPKVALAPDQELVEGDGAPGFAVLPGEKGRYRFRYRIVLEEGDNELAHLGIHFGPSAVALLEPWWLAQPEAAPLPGGREVRWLPPAWILELRVPGSMTSLSARAPDHEEIEEGTTGRRLDFSEPQPGRCWPFAVVGMYRGQEIGGRSTWIRLASRSTAPEGPVRFLERLSRTLADWLPPADTDWRLVTFPGAGDRALPNMILLDEGREWLSQPLDGLWMGQTRRVGLARQLAYRPFGVQLRAVGGGAPFLEFSLAEYGAWRLLEASATVADARALEEWWRQRESQAGELPRPLSTLPASDAQGPRRLLSRGALVWQAVERKAGRRNLDAVLRQFLERGTPWTTEELCAQLEARTGQDWEDFFRRHIYGREAPPAP